MDEGSDSFLSPPPDFYLEQPVLRANSPGCGAISVFETVRGGESKAVNNESERGRDGHLESFKADPYEMFEQVARPLSGCRFTYRNGGGGRIEMVTTRGTYCPPSFLLAEDPVSARKRN